MSRKDTPRRGIMEHREATRSRSPRRGKFSILAPIVILLAAAALFWARAQVAEASQQKSGYDEPAYTLRSATGSPALARLGGKLSARLGALAHVAGLGGAARAAQARALSLPAGGAGALLQDAQGRVLVDIRVATTAAAALQALRGSGAAIAHVSGAYRDVTAFVHPADLDKIAALGAVQNVREVLAPMLANPAPGNGEQAHAVTRAAAANLSASSSLLPSSYSLFPSSYSLLPASSLSATSYACPQGVAVSEGDSQLQAAKARAAYSVDGSGIKVGILSDSYDADTSAVTHAAGDIASGDLPGASTPCGTRYQTAVHVLEEDSASSPTDEGRAMLQIVHDLAPAASLGFATALNQRDRLRR